VKYEAEIVAMTAHLLGAGATADPVVGTVTSGGTESILLAMRAYRDRARAERGQRAGADRGADNGHAAFDKAAHYFGMELVRVAVGADYRADVADMAAAIDRNTVALVGSAPSFPHGASTRSRRWRSWRRRAGRAARGRLSGWLRAALCT
jgi:sphinganine-1-phosphate aldolase